ncbi:protein of unknown function UPF0150 [Dethiosulfovibrio peptidovorans DSM 11002]|uniref:HicB-like antitoxin of toxin-antitoxin system domain-containing protein n=1 Tax=Dethiosulfovibrio peptidovorans DSM 11002 TaxID=469381 RepID=D2Z4P7_9BACT|nr:type II toxin-antitoxin system HicB family antitoxin [Dethiosulfovibrio peptidovorans]EFC92391.1 protein of unknown function UPF0150 [Dethiosulfovibrio peptidovorans DSM 11002]
MQDRYNFPAVFHYNSDGRIGIYFPDLPGCVSQATSDEEGIKKATEALELHIFGMEEDGDSIPDPSRLSDIDLEPGERTVMISAIMPLVRDAMESKAIKKTLTLPYWLNRAAEAKGVNFSALLQNAIRENLGIQDERRY